MDFVHLGVMKYTCNKCGRSFEDLQRQQLHLDPSGNCKVIKRNFQCNSCRRTFIKEASLAKHMATVCNHGIKAC